LLEVGDELGVLDLARLRLGVRVASREEILFALRVDLALLGEVVWCVMEISEEFMSFGSPPNPPSGIW